MEEEIQMIMNDMICIIEENPKKSKKSVIFANTARVRLIPSKREIIEQSLVKELWWDRNDYMCFRNNAVYELREFFQTFPEADVPYYTKNLWTVVDFDAIYSSLLDTDD
jgi:hypothetical protein